MVKALCGRVREPGVRVRARARVCVRAFVRACVRACAHGGSNRDDNPPRGCGGAQVPAGVRARVCGASSACACAL